MTISSIYKTNTPPRLQKKTHPLLIFLTHPKRVIPRGANMAEMRLREPVEPEPDHTGVGKVSFQ
jgi:hypothetical protein